MPYVFHGSDWPEHEDYLIGDREGLELLKASIDEALVQQESKVDVQEFVGVRCLDKEFFQSQCPENNRLNNFLGLLGLFLVFVIFAAGLTKIWELIQSVF